MSLRVKALLVVGLLVIVGALAAYSLYFRTPSAEAILAEVQKLRDLALQQKDCTSAITEADAFLKKAPEAAEVWHWKGICEFETGNYEEAKKSFEQVLALDPNHQAAKNYLQALGPDPSQYFDPGKAEISREDFESRLEGILDEKKLIFSQAVMVPPPSNLDSSELVIAKYESMTSAGEIADYLNDFLKKNNYQLKGGSMGGQEGLGDEFQDRIFISGTKGKKTVNFTIWKEEIPVQVGITYMLLK